VQYLISDKQMIGVNPGEAVYNVKGLTRDEIMIRSMIIAKEGKEPDMQV
jgi:hypothetical protein